MKNRTLALLGTGGIIYRKEVREYAGSVTGSLLMQQLDYWFTQHPDGFYKFLDPTPKHPDYREGDSWTEELGFSKAEFRNAFDGIGVRHSSKSVYIESPNPFIGLNGEKFYCSYHDKKNGLTWYFRNHPKVDDLIEELCKVKPAKYRKKLSTVDKQSESTVNQQSESTVNQQSESTVNQQSESTVNVVSESIEINNVDLHRSTKSIYINEESESTFYIQRLSSEITSETTSERIPPNPQIENGEKGEEKSQPAEVVESGSALDQIGFPDQSKPESLQQTENLPLGQNSPAPLAKAETTADRVRRTWQETGMLPCIPMELEAWVQIDLGSEIVASYRKSGRVTTTKLGDIQPTFASYVASQWKGKDIDYGYTYIRSLEKDPTKWETLAALVIKWQASKSTNNHNLNITQEVERASKPVIDFGGIRL